MTLPLSPWGRGAGMRGRHTVKFMRAAMRRAAARRRLAVLLRRKPFGRVSRPLDTEIFGEAGRAPQRPFAWRKGGVQ